MIGESGAISFCIHVMKNAQKMLYTRPPNVTIVNWNNTHVFTFIQTFLEFFSLKSFEAFEHIRSEFFSFVIIRANKP